MSKPAAAEPTHKTYNIEYTEGKHKQALTQTNFAFCKNTHVGMSKIRILKFGSVFVELERNKIQHQQNELAFLQQWNAVYR